MSLLRQQCQLTEGIRLSRSAISHDIVERGTNSIGQMKIRWQMARASVFTMLSK